MDVLAEIGGNVVVPALNPLPSRALAQAPLRTLPPLNLEARPRRRR